MDVITASEREQGTSIADSNSSSVASVTVVVPSDDRIIKQFKRPTNHLTTFKGLRLDRQDRIEGSRTRNSLESINSRFSTSSFILEDQTNQHPEHEICQQDLVNQHQLVAMLDLKPVSLDLVKFDEKSSYISVNEKSMKQKEEQRLDGRKLSSTSCKSTTIQREDGSPFMFAGIAASILGSVIGSVGFLCAKLLPDNSFQGSVTTLMIRGLFIVFFTGITSLTQGSRLKIRRDEIWVNFSRAIFGTCGVLGTYCAMRYISLGDATALVFSSPIWTSLLSRIILKEKLQWIQLMALPTSLFGIVLIAHPALIVDVSKLSLTGTSQLSGSSTSFNTDLIPSQMVNGSSTTTDIAGNDASLTDHPHPHPHLFASSNSLLDEYEQRWPGVVIALCTSLCVSCTYIVLKFRKNTPIQTTTFWYGICMVVVSGILFALFIENPQVPTSLHEWTLYTTIGVTSWLSQCVLQWAFLYETAAVLSVVRTLDVAMVFILSAIFISDEIYWTSVLGASIISLSVASIMLNNWILTCPFMKNNDDDDDDDGDQNEETDLKEAKKIPIQSQRKQVYHLNIATVAAAEQQFKKI